MKWTEPAQPNEHVSRYDHVFSESPLGMVLIEWKSWKVSDSFSVTIGNVYIGEGLNLEDAKRIAKDWLLEKHNELSEVLALPCRAMPEGD